MRTGKLTNEQLDRLILKKLKHTRREVICAPSVGVDCTAVNLNGGLAVLSCDPITAAESGLGRLTVNVSCNDAAAAGAEPIGLMVTLLLPPHVNEEEIETVMDDIVVAAAAAKVDVIGGHTEITPAVNRIVTCATVIARPVAGSVIMPTGMKPGDEIVMTKHAGLEGAMILADKAPDWLLSDEEKADVKAFAEQTSVVREGLFAAAHGAHAMHDVTEGGIFGALWELSAASGCDIDYRKDSIVLHPVTEKLCRYFAVDPYKLISSGCMLIAVQNGEALVKDLGELGICAAVIGKAKKAADGCFVRDESGSVVPPPEADEIYKVFD